MLGPSSVLCYSGCGYQLKQELKVCVVPSVSCHCSHAQNQTGRPNCPGSLGCAVDRVSAQVPLLSIYTWKLRPGEKSCSSKVRQNRNVGSGTTVSESSSLASYCASRSANWIFLKIAEHVNEWLFLVIFAYLTLNFLLISLAQFSLGHHWFCIANTWCFSFCLSSIIPWLLMPRPTFKAFQPDHCSAALAHLPSSCRDPCFSFFFFHYTTAVSWIEL